MHHPDAYAIEAILLATFMFIACGAVVAMEHPASPVYRTVPRAWLRRCLIGLAMGVTAVCLILSPWGQRSGAHMNPAVTLAWAALGKVSPTDAAWYIFSQFVGGIVGVLAARLLFGHAVAHASVNYAATLPGRWGPAAAFVSEFLISFVLFATVLIVTNSPRLAPYTPVFAGGLVALYIAVEAPISGMSINPARTLGSALFARAWRGTWIYFIAPPAAMLLAAAVYTGAIDPHPDACPKLRICTDAACVFGDHESSATVRHHNHTATPKMR